MEPVAQQNHSQLADLINNSSEVPIITRPQQTGQLPQLPNEILQQIIEDKSLKRKDLRSLALSSFRLFHLARCRFYFLIPWQILDKELENGQIDILQRCFALGCVPHFLRAFCPAYRELVMKVRFQLILDEYCRGCFSFQKCSDAIIWLHDHQHFFAGHHESEGLEGHNPCSCYFCDGKPVYDYRTWALQEVYRTYMRCGQRKFPELEQLIQVLLDHGARVTPSHLLRFHEELPEINGSRDVEISHVLIFKQEQGDALSCSIAFQTPAALLELTMQTYLREGVRVRSSCKIAEMRNEEHSETISEVFKQLLRCIYAHIFRIWHEYSSDHYEETCCYHVEWTEDYHGQIADIVEEKVEILTRYDYVTDHERKYLDTAVSRLRKIYELGTKMELDFDLNGRCCWHILFGSEPFPEDWLVAMVEWGWDWTGMPVNHPDFQGTEELIEDA